MNCDKKNLKSTKNLLYFDVIKKPEPNPTKRDNFWKRKYEKKKNL